MIDDDNNQDACSPERHVFMAIINEQYANELPDQISANELMTNTLQDENDARMAAQRAKNAKRVERRANAADHTCDAHPILRNLQGAFAAEDKRMFNSPKVNIAEATLLLQQAAAPLKPGGRASNSAHQAGYDPAESN